MEALDFKISQRLFEVALLIEKGSVVADVGTDHGYLPIYLVKSGISPKVIAMDVKAGPLGKAKANVEGCGVEDKITLRLSDGLAGLTERCDAVTVCGMGGRLIQKILTQGYDKLSAVKQIIVSPQSEVPQFRKYLRENGFVTAKERIIFDEGKYYFIMDCRMEERCGYISKESVFLHNLPPQDLFLQDVYDMFGRYLLERKDAVLKEFLLKERSKLSSVRENVHNSGSGYAQARVKELDYRLKCIEKGLDYYEML